MRYSHGKAPQLQSALSSRAKILVLVLAALLLCMLGSCGMAPKPSRDKELTAAEVERASVR